MSRILKASYVKIDTQNIIIDNKMDTVNEYSKNDHIDETKQTQYIEMLQEEVIETARIQAEAIIDNAKKEAETIIDNAKLEAKEIAENTYKKSYEEGYENAIIEAQEKKEQMEQMAQQTIDDANEKKQEILKNIEPEILDTIIKITKNILCSEYNANKDIITILIQKGLQNIKEIKDLKIYVSNENYEYVEENKDSITGISTKAKNIEIIKDISLNSTDCIIETNIGSINCSVDEQLEGIKEAMYHILD